MALQDRIGRDDIVNKICGLVNSLKKDEHFCLAINGAWGSGKSFVLGLLEENFETLPEYIVVKYDAWENTFYSEPLIAILSCLIDGLESRLSKFKGYAKVCRQAAGKKGKELLSALSEKTGKIGTFATILKEIIEIVPQLKSVSLLEDTKDNQLSCFKSYQSLISDATALLNKVTDKKWVDEKQTKLIVLVDEIDRCLPDEQLKILERLHHLFGVKNCAVIVAMNQACVAKTVKTIYGIDGYEYLHKFFDFTFKLEMSSEIYLKNLFEGFVSSCEKLQPPANEVSYPVGLAYLFTSHLISYLPAEKTDKYWLDDKIRLEFESLKESFHGAITLEKDGEFKPGNSTDAPVRRKKKDTLERIIEKVNDKYNGEFTDSDRVIISGILNMFMNDAEIKKYKRYAMNNDSEMFINSLFPDKFMEIVAKCFLENNDTFKKLYEDSEFKQKVMQAMGKELYSELRKKKDNNES